MRQSCSKPVSNGFDPNFMHVINMLKFANSQSSFLIKSIGEGLMGDYFNCIGGLWSSVVDLCRRVLSSDNPLYSNSLPLFNIKLQVHVHVLYVEAYINHKCKRYILETNAQKEPSEPDIQYWF